MSILPLFSWNATSWRGRFTSNHSRASFSAVVLPHSTGSGSKPSERYENAANSSRARHPSERNHSQRDRETRQHRWCSERVTKSLCGESQCHQTLIGQEIARTVKQKGRTHEGSCGAFRPRIIWKRKMRRIVGKPANSTVSISGEAMAMIGNNGFIQGNAGSAPWYRSRRKLGSGLGRQPKGFAPEARLCGCSGIRTGYQLSVFQG
jgi:uncharacterized low-complexity protein